MKIEVEQGYPQQEESAMSKLHPWMMKHYLFVDFKESEDGKRINVFIEDAEEAKELAQELLHCYNKLIHWIGKQEEQEE